MNIKGRLLPPAARGSFEKPPLDPVKLLVRGFFKIINNDMMR